MSGGLIGNVASLKDFAAKLRTLPQVLANEAAARAAPGLTEAARATFGAGQDAFGVSWAPSADGGHVTLHASGALENGIRYVATGTRMRVALPVSYAKYQLGRRPAFPRQGDPLPPRYAAAINDAVQSVCRTHLEGP